MNDIVKNFGKIRYIEPNDLLKGGLNDLTHPYEDYSISVDLIVQIPPRMNGFKFNDNVTIFTSNGGNEFTTFLNGTDGYMTDTPSSITFYDILNKENKHNENLGITDINITYNSYFYPEVTIKFTDVRGGSLMMPNEEIYNNEQKGNEINNIENFFAALFSFPYPEFKLRVKGFYGQKVEYSLLVSDFRSSFNNQTGNFEATVKFLGRMFGVYSDIPMLYLLIAPYCKYGTKNTTIWEEKKFKFPNGSDIPRLLELRELLLKAKDGIYSDVQHGSIIDYNVSNKNLTKIQTIKSLLDDFIYKMNNIDGVKYDVNECVFVVNNDFDINVLKSEITILYDNINGYTGLPYINGIIKENNNIKIDSSYKPENISPIYTGDNVCYFSYKNLYNTLKNEENIQLNTLKEAQDTLSNNVEENLIKLIGFKPSIKNIFMMLMAHIETFTEIYKIFLENTTDNNSRKLTDLDLSFGNLTDLPNVNGLNIPPFPGIKDSNNSFCYPTEINVTNMEEDNFINSLLTSVYSVTDYLNDVVLFENQVNDESCEFIPTLHTDLYKGLKNPYQKLFDDKNSDIGIDWLLTVFGIRCLQHEMIEQPKNIDSNFGKFEAYNFYRFNQNLSSDIKNKIKSDDFTVQNFIKFLCGEDNPYYLNGEPCYKTNDNSKKIISRNKNNFKLPSLFNLPLSINRDKKNDFLRCFWDDSNDYLYALTSSSYFYPYGYCYEFTDNNILNSIHNNVSKNGTDFQNTLVSRYLHNTNVFTENDGVLCTKQEKLDKFYDYTKKSIKTFYDDFLKPEKIKNVIQDSLDEYSIDSIKKYKYGIYGNDGDVKNIPYSETNIFLLEELTPEEFLMLMPYDNETLGNFMFNDGPIVVTIPYVTQLFIGMVIKNTKEGKLNDLLDKLKKINKSSISGIDKIIVSCTLNSHGHNNSFFIMQSGEKDNRLRTLENLNNIKSEMISIDIFGFEKKYEDWLNDKWFEDIWNYYKLNDRNTEQWGDIKLNSSTLEDRLDSFLKNNKNELKLDDFKKIFNKENDENWLTDRFSTIIPYTTNMDSIVKRTIYLSFNKDNDKYDKLSGFFKQKNIFLIPYKHNFEKIKDDNNLIYCEYDRLSTHFNTFKDELKRLYNLEDNKTQDSDNKTPEMRKFKITNELKLSMYLTLKNLYDKHFFNLKNDADKYKITDTSSENEFKRFHFVDTFFNDISEELCINIENLIELTSIMVDGYNNENKGLTSSDMNVYSFMSLICEKTNTMLMVLPIFNDSFKDSNGDNLINMFKPLPWNDSLESLKSPAYVCMYSHQPSRHLDLPNNQYTNDGFNIVDINDTANFEGPISIPDLCNTDTEYVIPAFGVEYGSQKQSIFKTINVNMDNPQTTEASVMTQFDLANKNKTPNTIGFIGQDLFKVYSNYSYTCQVDMMGCVQITPLMYFQLNNIPMFRGTYQIINVEHRITPGDMSTSFKGVRLNKTKIPMVKELIATEYIAEFTDKYNNSSYSIDGDYNISQLYMNYNDNIIKRSNITYSTLKNEYGEYFKTDKPEGSINGLNSELLSLIDSILNDLKTDGKLSLRISSATRSGNGSSDHNANSSKASEKRKSIKEKDGTTFDKLGCAVDLHTQDKNKAIDSSIEAKKTTPTLFKTIATKYPYSIRQLIWEYSNGESNENVISNCLHLASYYHDTDNSIINKNNNNDKHEIFVSADSGGKSYPVKYGSNGIPTNIPSMFLFTMYDMCKNNNNAYNLIKWNNFGNNKPTLEDLTKWCTYYKLI